MQIIQQTSDLAPVIQELKSKGSLGFVPTMGALHQGHLSLVKKSIETDANTVVSIFVNPTQFNNPNDLKNYPRNNESDCKKLKSLGCDLVFIPDVEGIYPEPDTRVFDLNGLDQLMEGKHRPGHFNGVAQVVTKLFDLVEPDNAYFGEKDFQQLAIIKYLVNAYNYPVEIISMPTMREPDGLAMSSRNALLTAKYRKGAPFIYKQLSTIHNLAPNNTPDELRNFIIKAFDHNPLLNLEYFELADSQTLTPVHNWKKPTTACIAVHAANVRLIDNVGITLKS